MIDQVLGPAAAAGVALEQVLGGELAAGAAGDDVALEIGLAAEQPEAVLTSHSMAMPESVVAAAPGSAG